MRPTPALNTYLMRHLLLIVLRQKLKRHMLYNHLNIPIKLYFINLVLVLATIATIDEYVTIVCQWERHNDLFTSRRRRAFTSSLTNENKRDHNTAESDTRVSRPPYNVDKGPSENHFSFLSFGLS